MDIRLRQIVPKAPGIYFVVTDNSQVQEIEETSNLRIVFINAPKGPVNCLVKFAKGDITSFRSVFGTASRAKEKKGDFGHKVCEDALVGGPIGVVNLRAFDSSRDLTQVASLNPNTKLTSAVRTTKVPYTDLFNKNNFWTASKDNITSKYYETTGFLNFGNVSVNDVSIFVVKATDADVKNKTSEYDKTLEETSLEITDYEGIRWDTKVKDTFVKVYVFANTFANASANPSYGQYFNANNQIKQGDLDNLAAVTSASFLGSYVGSLIPELVNENSESISIDTVMYQDYLTSGVLCDINQDLLEPAIENLGMIDTFGYDSMMNMETGVFKTIPAFMSYISNTPTYDRTALIPAVPTKKEDIVSVDCINALKYGVTNPTSNSFTTISTTGLHIDDYIIGSERLVQIKDIKLGEEQTVSVTKPLFDAPDKISTVGNLIYMNGKYYCLNNKAWATSIDGKTWVEIEEDFFTTPTGKQIKYPSDVNNAVVSSNKIYAVGYCQDETANYIVSYDGVNVSMTKLSGTGETNTNIAYNNGVFVVYSASRTLFSTDGLNWTTATTTTVKLSSVVAVSGITGAKFLGLDKQASDYNIVYSNDGDTWTAITSTYKTGASALSMSDAIATKNVFMEDGNNIYIFGTNNFFYIAKADINDNTKSWNKSGNFDTTAYSFTSNNVYPVIVGSGTDNMTVLLNTRATATATSKLITLTFANKSVDVNPGPEGVTSDKTMMFNGSNIFFLNTNATGNTEYKIYTGSAVSEEYNFATTQQITYRPATYTVDGALKTFTETTNSYIVKVNPYVKKSDSLLSVSALQSYKPVDAQFIDGTQSRQEEILNMMLNTGIVKGLKDVKGFAYVVDAFKSFIVGNYKWQYSNLCNTMHEKNKFIRCITTDVFVSDLLKSTNPLFKDTPADDTINYEYVESGGNRQYSTTILTKPDNQFMYFFGPEDIINDVPKSIAGLISNLFVNKTYPFDIVANSTGYISPINQLGDSFDDVAIKCLLAFRYNPTIDLGDGFSVYGNTSGQKMLSKQSQIHNVELLCYIKETLYSMCRPDTFKKGTYDEYLDTQTRCEDFFNSLVLAQAIKSDGLVVKCDLENNTNEIQNYKIKLVHIEYVPFDCIEKVVFDININK